MQQYAVRGYTCGNSYVPVKYPWYIVSVYVIDKFRKLMVRSVSCTENLYNDSEIGSELLVLCCSDGMKIGFLPENKEDLQ